MHAWNSFLKMLFYNVIGMISIANLRQELTNYSIKSKEINALKGMEDQNNHDF